jgi:hypothetical protein
MKMIKSRRVRGAEHIESVEKENIYRIIGWSKKERDHLEGRDLGVYNLK